VDASTACAAWTYDPDVAGVAGEKDAQGLGIRELGYAQQRVFAGTQDGRLLALDAASGKLLWSVMTIDAKDDRYITGPPLTFKN